MATLSIVESVEAFVETIEKSGLLSEDAMAKVRQAAASADKPMTLARPLVKDGTLTKWQASQLLYGYHQLVVGKYKLLDQLGVGEMGRVYLAEHAQMGRRHCLKVLARRNTSKPEVLQRFLDDAQRVCVLEHRNLSHVYDVNQDGDRYFVVMEYVEGQSLQSLVEKSGKLAPAEAIGFVHQAAEGLAHAHEHGIVHGDLKPSNLMLDPNGILKILDIGQARLAEGPQSPSEKDETSETPSLAAAIHYAPERRGAVRTIDQRSDIYSLGSVLCFLLTGKAAADAALAESQLKKSNVPAALAALCQKMMAENPEDRPATMEAVLAGLAEAERESTLPPMPAAKSAESKPPVAANGQNGAKGAEPPPKAKKPPVAKPLGDSGSLPKAKPLTAPAAPAPAPASAPPEEVPSPFAGFTVQTSGTSASKKPPVKSPSGEVPAVGTLATAAPASAKTKTSYLPLIIGGSIGGGLLVIAGISLIVWVAFFRDRGPAVVAEAPQEPTEAVATEIPPEGNPSESNPAESNPAGESNPGAAVAPAATIPNEAQPAEPKPTEPAPEQPMPEVKPADPPMPAPAPADPPMPAPMPTPAPPKPTPKPTPKPMPAGNPFEGFAKAVSLPKLEGSEPPPEALVAKVLGPCKVAEQALVIARLKGGEFASRGGRQKFELAAANGGTALQDWDVNLVGPEGPLVIAKLSAKGGNLTFQWTPDGAKETTAPFLCNCALELSAPGGNMIVALREPVTGPPLTIDLEKAGAAAKWQVDNLPDPKNIYFEVTSLEGIPRQKYVPENLIRGAGEDIYVWTGPADDVMALGLKLTSSAAGKNLQVSTMPQIQFEGMKKPERYSKKVMTTGKTAMSQKLGLLTQQLNSLSGRDPRTEQQRGLINQEIETLNKGASQVDALLGFIEALQGTGKMHFRIYYEAEESQVDLLVTSNDAVAEEVK